MGIREVIHKRAKQAAQEYKVDFINEQKSEYEKIVTEYEKLVTEQYQLDFRLEFVRAMERQKSEPDKDKDIEKLKQRQMVLLKKIKDIENSGILEQYDTVMEAINAVNKA